MKLLLILFLIFTSNSFSWNRGTTETSRSLSKKVSVVPSFKPPITSQTPHPDCSATLSEGVRTRCPNHTLHKEEDTCVFRCSTADRPLEWNASDDVQISLTNANDFTVISEINDHTGRNSQ